MLWGFEHHGICFLYLCEQLARYMLVLNSRCYGRFRTIGSELAMTWGVFQL